MTKERELFITYVSLNLLIQTYLSCWLNVTPKQVWLMAHLNCGTVQFIVIVDSSY
jgi:hypothetical protein